MWKGSTQPMVYDSITEASILRLLIAKGSCMDQGYMTKLEVVKNAEVTTTSNQYSENFI